MNKTDQLCFFGFEAGVSDKPAKPAKPANVPAPALADTPTAAVAPVPVVAPAPDATPMPAPAQPAAVLVLEVHAPAAPEALSAPVAPAVPANDPEAMAQTLAQHPDFRVLRRLQPVADYGGLHGQPTQRVIVLDTETTGLDSKSEKVIELAMLSVLVDSATGLPVGPVTIYESFEDPGKPIPPQITEITGIDDSMVLGLRIDDAAVTALVEQADLIVAHNAGFDRPFVEGRWPVFASKALSLIHI
jgi:DNA polymerase-3 subunit epsilon